jgi:mannose/cellobiose epimerase-like protein (N-acyl-D-glucosamine 2-epimerase family)
MLATINRWLGTVLFILAACVGAVGVYLGGFAWLNDGLKAGVRLFGTAMAFALALAATGVVLRFAADAHGRGDARRWWIQFGTLLVAYLAFGLAAWTTSLLDRVGRR